MLAGMGCAEQHAKKAAEAPARRERMSFDDGWRFEKGDGTEKEAYAKEGFDDSWWRRVNVPHDWAIEGPFVQADDGATGKKDYWEPAWYRKHFNLPASDAGRRIYLDFDGAMSHAQVWVNGNFAGEWPYGYASFEIDATPWIRPGGENVVAVRLQNEQESSRWYPGAGIERNVWLVKTDAVHVAHWGTVVTTPEVSEKQAAVAVQAEVKNDGMQDADVTVQSSVMKADGDGKPKGKALAMTAVTEMKLPPGKSEVAAGQVRIDDPKLWELRSPERYVVVTSVKQGGMEVDRYETPFGIRTIAYDAKNGFRLNGKRVEFNGVCDHADLGPLGAVVNVRGLERQIELLQEMGCNSIRTSHNPPAPELLDLCDRMGMLVMDEGFDCWQIAKRPGDYHLLWADWHEKDWRAQLHRDRNHPSVVIWSIGNELREFKQTKVDGQKIAAELTRIAHEEDPTRPTTFACNAPGAGYNGYQKTVDIFGLNYRTGEYAKFIAKNPEIPFVGSETASTVSSRGEYVFPVVDVMDKDKVTANFQVSSYDLFAPPWATTPDAEFKALDENPTVLGEFVWTGFDYLGEPTPFNKDVTNLLNFTDPAQRDKMAAELKTMGKIEVPSRSSYFGILDLCGFKKDRFYLYQARWRPDFAMVHILPHWNWPDRVGQVTPVFVYTSGDEAELFLNGKSLGKKTIGKLQYRLRWDDVKYEPGELKAVAYKNGQKWAEETVKTTGAAAALKVAPDRRTLKDDGEDLSYVTVSVVDKDGLMVPRSNTMLHVSIEGPATIAAMDNGDATGHRSFQSTDCPAFNGLCMVIVRTKKGEKGDITLHVHGEGVDGAEAVLASR